SLVAQRRQRRGKPGFGKDCRVDAVGKLAQLTKRCLGLTHGRFEKGRNVRLALRLGCRPCEAQIVGESEEALLRTVVEITLEPTPFRVAGRDDTRPRDAEILDLSSHLGLELLVLHGDTGRGEDLLEQTGLVEQALVVHEGGENGLAAEERGYGSVGAGPDVGRSASGVDV